MTAPAPDNSSMPHGFGITGMSGLGEGLVLDLFAGPGGWDEGARMLGEKDTLGIEWDRAACDTALAVGHARIWADVAALPIEAVTAAYGPVTGLIASPPCQAWSMAGKRKGERDRAACHALADRMAAGDDSTGWIAWEDERSPLVCQPVRWVRELRPAWVALEEVPAVASLWEHFARIFRGWGYSAWTGDLCAADYGVPQTRVRRILIARRDGAVALPPEPTHAAEATGGCLFGGTGRQRWVSMAQALGWGIDDRPSTTVMARNGDEHGGAGGPRPLDGGSGAREVYRRAQREGRWRPVAMGDVRAANGTVRPVGAPAATLTASMDNGNTQWVYDRPATTVQGDPRVGRPGHKDRDGGESQFAEGSVRVTVQEAGVLQSFPPDYPWRGSRTKRYQQVGNAIPPLLAAHVLAALGVGDTRPWEDA